MINKSFLTLHTGVEGTRVTEVDTARFYGQGSSEEYLGEIGWHGRGLEVHTKIYPTAGKNMGGDQEWTHRPADLRAALMRSKVALKASSSTGKEAEPVIDMWYLHGPDRSVPFEETLREVNNLYLEGHFRRFGISNYMAWEVAQICELCRKHGWVQPSVYQGLYNALHRAVEPELFPCLRHYGLAFFAFQPLAGGFLTDRYHRDTLDFEAGSRFDPDRWQGRFTRARYWNEPYFDALDLLRPVAKLHGLTEAECALRWLTHHSLLRREHGDAVIVGASSAQQLEQNLVDCEKGPLPEEVVQALDAGWQQARSVMTKYWH